MMEQGSNEVNFALLHHSATPLLFQIEVAHPRGHAIISIRSSAGVAQW
jgi:hypothetical protein